MRKFFISSIMAMLTMSALADNVVFITTAGDDNNDGLTAQTPVKTMEKAYTVLNSYSNPTEGTMVICGNYEQPSDFKTDILRYKHDFPVTITQVYGGVDYREQADGYWELKAGRIYKLVGPTVFKNITFNLTAAKSSYFYVVADSYPVTIDEGCKMEGNFNWTSFANAFSLIGGCHYSSKTDTDELRNPSNYGSNITVNSGKLYIAAFNRGSIPNVHNNLNLNYVPQSKITINGGDIYDLVCGSTSKNLLSGDVDLNINGGNFLGSVVVGTNGSYWTDGDVSVTIKGGNFSKWGIFKAADKGDATHTELYLTSAGTDELPVLVNTPVNIFNTIHSNYKIPFYGFTNSADYSATNGTTLTYRLGSSSKMEGLPIVLSLDEVAASQTFLSDEGCALLYPVWSYTDTQVVAPTFPAAEATTLEAVNDAWSDEKNIEAAVELLDKITADNNSDSERTYLLASASASSGAWKLLGKYPEKFSAAIIAGTGDTGSGNVKTSIRSFEASDTETADFRAATEPDIAKWLFDQKAISSIVNAIPDNEVGKITIYDTTGKIVVRSCSSDQLATLRLNSGTYIMKSGKKTLKVLVK